MIRRGDHGYDWVMRKGPGTTGNIIAAVCSFLVPGLGQLVQGRIGWAIIHFLLCLVLWAVWLGWIAHIWSTIDAALYKPEPDYI